jgi:hypothetical protein
MKKGKMVIVGLIALVMACGLVLAGCGKLRCSNNRKCFKSDSIGSSCNSSSCAVKHGSTTCNCL